MHHHSQKGFAIPAIIAVIVGVLVLGGAVYYANQSKEPDTVTQEEAMMETDVVEQQQDGAMELNENDGMMEQTDTEMVQDTSVMKDESAMVNNDETMMKYSGATLAGTSAPLLDFTKSDYDTAVKTDKLIVLYFYANWCPTCKAEFPVMQKVFDKLTTDNVIGFRVNYNDNQTDEDEKKLAREFGVAYQHTKVFVKNGQRILKSPEGWDMDRYETEIGTASGQ